ncbi:methyl-accepting chemotaxis protein [Bacillus alkalisoli]|uniref:methyl-accepting chemotaxis protein n=1 Tax=Bacillus alkalisoli TaxID=2011008 RepID=UPI000C245269|nr:methyl-accepting chemotaxis protein [Bacillus alkalisoli]
MLRTIKSKLIFSISILIISLITICLVTIFSFTKLKGELDYIIENDFQVISNAKDIQKLIVDIETGERGFLFTGDTIYLEPYYHAKGAIVNKFDLILEDVSNSPQQVESINEILTLVDKWLVEYIDRNIDIRIKNDLQTTVVLADFEGGKYYMDQIRVLMEEFILEEQSLTENRVAELNSLILWTEIILIIFIVLIIIIATILGISITKNITTNLRYISQLILDMSNSGGDLTKRINLKSKDEIAELGENTNKLIESIGNLVKEVNQTANSVAISSEELLIASNETTKTISQIAETNNEIATGSEETSTYAESSLNKMEELNMFNKNVNEKVVIVKDKSSEMKEASYQGVASVNRQSESIQKLQSLSNANLEMMKILVDKSSEIEKIVEDINKIAEQTNLLALNAAIEASRAGEAGKGFAVVAAEVRKLAEQSKHSSKNVGTIISEIQQEMETAISSTSEVNDEAKLSVSNAKLTKESLSVIENKIFETLSLVDDIREEVNNTYKLSEEVTEVFREVSEIAKETSKGNQNNAAASEEGLAAMEQMNSSAVELAEHAHKLKEMVSSFKV